MKMNPSLLPIQLWKNILSMQKIGFGKKAKPKRPKNKEDLLAIGLCKVLKELLEMVVSVAGKTVANIVRSAAVASVMDALMRRCTANIAAMTHGTLMIILTRQQD